VIEEGLGTRSGGRRGGSVRPVREAAVTACDDRRRARPPHSGSAPTPLPTATSPNRTRKRDLSAVRPWSTSA